MTDPGRAGIIIVAAGESRRMGADKIFMMLGGKPLLAWSVDTCQLASDIQKIVLVLNESNIERARKLVKEHSWSKVTAVCPGGERRQDSVKEGLKNMQGCDWILVHDGARPFLSEDLIREGLSSVRETGAAVAAVPVKDTIKIASSDKIVQSTLDRECLWAAQTPQVFRSDIITEAYSRIKDDVTDDASLVEKLGIGVKIYAGSYNNIKITTAEDIELAEELSREYLINESRHRL